MAAILFSCGANAEHGFRRTNEDKRRAVMKLLDDPEWQKWSNEEIARRARVSSKSVARLREELITLESQSEPRTFTTKHGTQAEMNTAAIGKRKPQSDIGKRVPSDDDAQPVEHATPRGGHELPQVID